MDFYATSMELKTFDLKHTFDSAQPLTFHGDYNPTLNSLIYASGNSLISVMYVGNRKRGKLITVSEDVKLASNDVAKRFRTSDNMRQIYKKINTDKFMDSAIKEYEGMRLTVNDPWETTVCYIISQFNNVKRIRLIIKNMMNKFGTDILDMNGNPVAKAFPKSETLMNASIKEIMKCGTGFRAKYIKSAAEHCTNNLELDKLNPNDYDKLKEELMNIDGIGGKVADCIILMGYGNLQAFPIDVWVKRTVEKVYFKGKDKKAKEIYNFAEEKWGKKYMGYAQQYLFYGGRQLGRENIQSLEDVYERTRQGR